MTFGEILDSNKIVIFCFVDATDKQYDITSNELIELSTLLSNMIPILKVNINENTELAKGLFAKHHRTFIIYQNNEMKYRSHKDSIEKIVKITTSYINK